VFSFDDLMDVLGRAAGPDGWKVRTPEVVGGIDDQIGKPLTQRLSDLRSLAPKHKHEEKADKDQEFIFQEKFGLPETLLPNVRRFLEKEASDGSWNIYSDSDAYLAFSVGHAWQWKADDGMAYPPHIRWGFTLEAAKDRYERAKSVLEGDTLGQRLARLGGGKFTTERVRPMTGFNRRRAVPATWFIFFGKFLPAEEVKKMGSLEAIVDAAAKDLAILHEAISGVG
jgi:hypothetical protein